MSTEPMNPAERTIMQHNFFRKSFIQRKPDAMNSYYNLRGGIHSAEIRLLQRALKEHMQTAVAHKATLKRDPGTKNFEHKQAQDAIDAMVRLSDRLRHELVAIAPKV